MLLELLILFALALIVFIIRKDLHREMIVAGLLALPVLLIKPLISSNFLDVATHNGGVFFFLLERALIGFFFGSLSSAIYELVFSKRISPAKHPLRPKMLSLLIGVLAFGITYLLFGVSFINSLILALAIDLILILFIRKDLVWDMIFSGTAMGILYLIIFVLTFRSFPGDISNLWFSGVTTGINLFSVPVEELFAVVLFGSLWGPIYVAIKDIKEK